MRIAITGSTGLIGTALVRSLRTEGGHEVVRLVRRAPTAADEVRWESGAHVALFRGGHNAVTGQQSQIAVNSIIGTKGVPRINPFTQRPGLTNSKLFARDRNICAYCGDHFHEDEYSGPDDRRRSRRDPRRDPGPGR